MFISYMNFILILGGLGVTGIVWLNNREVNDVNIKASVDELTKVVRETKEEQKTSSANITQEFNKKFEAASIQQQSILVKVDNLNTTNQLFSGRLDLQDQKLTQISRQLDNSEGKLASFETRIAKNETGLEVLRALYDRLTGQGNKR
jgi:chromosome segregation ATPase